MLKPPPPLSRSLSSPALERALSRDERERRFAFATASLVAAFITVV